MKYEVLKSFKCKDTKKNFKAGAPYEGGRAEELMKLGYVGEVEEKKAPEKKAEKAEKTEKKK